MIQQVNYFYYLLQLPVLLPIFILNYYCEYYGVLRFHYLHSQTHLLLLIVDYLKRLRDLHLFYLHLLLCCYFRLHQQYPYYLLVIHYLYYLHFIYYEIVCVYHVMWLTDHSLQYCFSLVQSTLQSDVSKITNYLCYYYCCFLMKFPNEITLMDRTRTLLLHELLLSCRKYCYLLN